MLDKKRLNLKNPLHLSVNTKNIPATNRHFSISSGIGAPKLKPKSRSPKLKGKEWEIHNSSAEMFLFIEMLSEQSKLFHRKKFSQVYDSIFSWILKDDRGFYFGLEVKLVRLFFLVLMKRIKGSLVKKVANFPKILNLISQTLCTLNYYYKFLTTYINKTIYNFQASEVLTGHANEYPTLNDSLEFAFEENDVLPPFIELVAEKHGNFNEYPQIINSKYETNCFTGKMLELLILIGTYFQRTNSLNLAFCYYRQAHKIALILENSICPDILNICAKAHLSLAVFYLSFGRKTNKAKKLLYKIIVLSQCELEYRMAGTKPYENFKKAKLKVKRTLKTLFTVIMNLIYCFEMKNQIFKIAEALSIIEFLMNIFFSSNDEYKKTLIKIIKKFRKKYSNYIIENSELSEIIQGFLKNNYDFMQKLHPKYFPPSPEEKVLRPESPKLSKLLKIPSNRLKNTRKSMMNNPKIRFSLDFRNFRPNETTGLQGLESVTKRTASVFKKDREQVNVFDVKKENNIMESTSKKTINLEYLLNLDSGFDQVEAMKVSPKPLENSFLFSEKEESSLSFENNKESIIMQSGILQQFLEPKKTSSGFKTFREDYKPKILTTDEYFRKRGKKSESKESQTIKSKENSSNNVLLDSLKSFPRKHRIKPKTHKMKENYQKDFFTDRFESLIHQSFEQNVNFKVPKAMNEDFIKVLRSEDFDRNEFKFGKKMLEAKRKANLNMKNKLKPGFCLKNALANDLKNQAESVVAQKSLEEYIKEFQKKVLKEQLRRKISNNQELLEAERGFMKKEGMMRLSLRDTIVKHKVFFKLENYAKIIEKRIADSAKNKLKLQEHLNKKSIQETSTIDPLSPLSPKIVPPKKVAENKPKVSEQVCWNITEKTNKIVKGNVQESLVQTKSDIKKLFENLSPGQRKKKYKKIQREIINKLSHRTLNSNFQDLSLSAAINKQP